MKKILILFVLLLSMCSLCSCHTVSYTMQGDDTTNSFYIKYNMLKRQHVDNVLINLIYSDSLWRERYVDAFLAFSDKYFNNNCYEAINYIKDIPGRYCLYMYNTEVINKEDIYETLKKDISEIESLHMCNYDDFILLNNYTLEEYYNPNINPNRDAETSIEAEHPLYLYINEKIEYIDSHYESNLLLPKELFIGEEGKIQLRFEFLIPIIEYRYYGAHVEIYYKIKGEEIIFSNEPFDKK